ncbi:MAG: argininosuccinate lyase [Candidatus Sigynarchaeota archaeon]
MKDILRSRLSESLDELAASFISSLKDDMEIIEADIIGTLAHDYMLFKRNIISKKDIKSISKALLEIREDVIKGNFNLDNIYEDIHPLIEARVIEKIGIETGGKIHSGRSRNDQVAVDIRLKLRDYLLDIRKCVLELVSKVLEKAKKHAGTPFPLYTHLQPAQIGTFGHLLCGWAFELLRHANRLAECFQRTNMSPLGACAIGGTAFPIDRAITADILGFFGYIQNSMDAISSRDVIIENTADLANLSVFYSRIAEDLIIYSSSEYRFIDLPEKFCSVSSVLPQKKNPDTLELLRAKAASSISALDAELVLAKGTPSGYNRDFQDCKPPLWRIFPDLIMATRLLAKIIEDLELREEQIKASLEKSDLQALDLAEQICLSHDIPFRKAHELMATVVKYLKSKGKNISSAWTQSELEDIKAMCKRVVGDEHAIDENFIKLARKVDSFTTRQSAGSPSPNSMTEMLMLAGQELERLSNALSIEVSKIQEKKESFLKTIKELINSP